MFNQDFFDVGNDKNGLYLASTKYDYLLLLEQV